MGKIKLILDKRRILNDNTYPVKLYYYISGRGSMFISTDVYVRDGCLINNTVINIRNAEVYNAILTKKLFTMEDVLLRMRIDNSISTLSMDEIKRKVRIAISEYDIRDKTPTFNEVAKKFIATKQQEKTKQTCEYMLKKIAHYYKLNTLHFTEINTKFLTDFELKLRNDNISINTISIIFRNIRAVFNYAISEEVISSNCYPFRKFKIKHEQTRKRSLSLEQVRQLISLCPETEEKTKARDLFLLIIYLIGINATDLLNLKEIRNGRIEYRRAKTNKLYSIKVEPEALAIINKYRGNDFLLDIAYKNNFINHFDKILKKLGTVSTQGVYHKQIITPIESQLSSYYARHTWATFASELDIPKETIASALGHGGNTVTDIYINFNQKKIDEANRKVINYILGKE